MAGRYDRNPFDEEEEVNPFANPGSVPPATNARLSPLPPEPVDFNYGRGATVDTPLDSNSEGSNYKDLKKKEKELQAKEAELRRREQLYLRAEEMHAANTEKLSCSLTTTY